MILEFLISGKVYPAKVKKVKGKLKLFFITDDEFYNIHGFDLPNYCCKNVKHRWRSLRELKFDILNRKYTNAVILPKNN